MALPVSDSCQTRGEERHPDSERASVEVAEEEMQLITTLNIIPSPTDAFGSAPDKRGQERNQQERGCVTRLAGINVEA